VRSRVDAVACLAHALNIMLALSSQPAGRDAVKPADRGVRAVLLVVCRVLATAGPFMRSKLQALATKLCEVLPRWDLAHGEDCSFLKDLVVALDQMHLAFPTQVKLAQLADILRTQDEIKCTPGNDMSSDSTHFNTQHEHEKAVNEEACQREVLTAAVRTQLVQAAFSEPGTTHSNSSDIAISSSVKPVPTLLETLLDIEIVSSHRPDVLDPLADVLVALVSTPTQSAGPVSTRSSYSQGRTSQNILQPRTSIPRVLGCNGTPSIPLSAEAQTLVFDLLTQWMLYGRAGSNSSGNSIGLSGDVNLGRDRTRVSADAVVQQALATLASKDVEVVKSVLSCVEQLYHLCPAYQRALLETMLLHGHLEKLLQILQGFTSLTAVQPF